MQTASRRGFLQGGAVIVLGMGSPRRGMALACAAESSVGAGVGAIFNEQAYFDHSGRVRRYSPPSGLRSLEAIAELNETAFRTAHPYA